MKKIKIMDDEAVVSIVVAVLLIGLAISVTVMINSVYVPQWVEQQEASHMDQVANQFVSLKQIIDLQAMMEQPTALSSWITLGSADLPFFGTGRTFGRLTLHEDAHNVTIYSNEEDFAPIKYSIGSLKFESGNTYFVPQNYIYENGALILQQYSSDIAIGKPTFFITTYGQNISFTIIDLTSSFGKRTAAGHGIVPVQTEVKDVAKTQIPLVKNITIQTKYLNSWRIALNNTFKQTNSGFNTSEFDVTYFEDKVILTFYDTGLQQYPTLDIKYVRIYTQIAPGWIE